MASPRRGRPEVRTHVLAARFVHGGDGATSWNDGRLTRHARVRTGGGSGVQSVGIVTGLSHRSPAGVTRSRAAGAPRELLYDATDVLTLKTTGLGGMLLP